MIVFRYLEERELIGILHKETSNIGSHFPKTNSNTFKYKDNEKYLHFYKKAEDMIHIRKIHCKNDVKSRKPGSFYYCAFNIPVVQLIKFAGKGYYENSGYDTFYTTASEFAIPSQRFNPDWLIGYIKDDHTKPFDTSAFESQIKSGFRDSIGNESHKAKIS